MKDESYRLNLVPTNLTPELRAACVLSSMPAAIRRLGSAPTVVVIDLALSIDEAKLKAGGLALRRISRKSGERWFADLIIDESERAPGKPAQTHPISAPQASSEEAGRAVVLHEVGPFQQLSMSPFDVLMNELGH